MSRCEPPVGALALSTVLAIALAACAPSIPERRWLAPEQLSGSAPASGPVVRANSRGDVVSAWVEVTGNDLGVWSRRRVSGTWAPAELLESANMYSEAPELALNEGGSAFGLWTVRSPFPYGWLRGAHHRGAGWAAPQPLNDGTLDLTPQLGVLGVDGALALWQSRDSILWNRFDPQSGWGPPARLGVATPFACCSGSQRSWSDEEGHAFVLWYRNGEWAARYLDGPVGWGPELPMPVSQTVTSSGRFTLPPKLAVRPDGVIELLWERVRGSRDLLFDIWANQFVPRSGWTDLVALDTNPGFRECQTALVSDVVGSLAVWGCREGGTSLEPVRGTWYSRRSGSGSWSAARPVGSLPATAIFAHLAANGVGTSLALWNVTRGSQLESHEVWAASLVTTPRRSTSHGGDWDDPVVIAQSESLIASVGLQYQPSGEGLAILDEGRGTSWKIRSAQYVHPLWRQPQDVTSVRDHALIEGHGLVSLPSGEAVLVWSESVAEELGGGTASSPGTVWSSLYVAR